MYATTRCVGVHVLKAQPCPSLVVGSLLKGFWGHTGIGGVTIPALEPYLSKQLASVNFSFLQFNVHIMSNVNFPVEWEQNKLPELQTLHFKAVKLQKAIQSQDKHGLGQQELEVEFNDWFTPLDEQLCKLLDGGMFDMLAGRPDAIRLVSKVVSELPGNQEMFRRSLGRLMRVLESPI